MGKLTVIEVIGQISPLGKLGSQVMQDSVLILPSLPLLSDNGAGLAIAVSTYFDEVNRHSKKKDESTPSDVTKEDVKSNFGWLPQLPTPSITKNLRNAFNVWDAVSA